MSAAITMRIRRRCRAVGRAQSDRGGDSGGVRERFEGSRATKGEAYADAANVLREYLEEWRHPKRQVS
jgi:hypothetical protein